MQFSLVALKTFDSLLRTQSEIKHLGIHAKAHKDVFFFFPIESKEKRYLFKLVPLVPGNQNIPKNTGTGDSQHTPSAVPPNHRLLFLHGLNQ